MALPARQIAVYGEFGGGNFGNDASLLALLGLLQSNGYAPRDLTCFCRGPEHASRWLGVHGARISGRNPSRRLGRFRWLLRWVELIRDLGRMIRLIGSYSLVVVPGTGIVEDGVGAWKTPFDLFCLAVACKVRRRSLAVVCVGATLPARALTRFFYRFFLDAAAYRSYRDKLSRRAATELGVRADHDPVYADLAYSLSVTSGQRPRAGEVAVGVITHGGTDSRSRTARADHEAYVRGMVDLVGRLVAGGRRIRLCIGDRGDTPVAMNILDRLGSDTANGSVTLSESGSFMDVVDDVATCQLMIASRYHNLIAAALAGRPTIAIGYSEKHAELQRSLGLPDLVHDYRSLDVDAILAQVEAIEADLAAYEAATAGAVAGFREVLRRQEADLGRLVGNRLRAGDG